MTSILKVDTIQDADGNNIINESGNTITIGASGDTINVPSGATFNINGTAGTGVGGVNEPVWSAYNNATQNLSSGTATTVAYNTERIDTDSAFDTSTHRFTVPSGKGGTYFIAAGVRLEDGEFGRYIRVYVNGSQSDVIGSMNYGVASYTTDTQLSGIIALSASDYIEIKVNQHSGSNKDLQGLSDGWYRSYFQGFKLIQ